MQLQEQSMHAIISHTSQILCLPHQHHTSSESEWNSDRLERKTTKARCIVRAAQARTRLDVEEVGSRIGGKGVIADVVLKLVRGRMDGIIGSWKIGGEGGALKHADCTSVRS